MGGACGAEERREGSRSFVSDATSARRMLFVDDGRDGGLGWRRARRSG